MRNCRTVLLVLMSVFLHACKAETNPIDNIQPAYKLESSIIHEQQHLIEPVWAANVLKPSTVTEKLYVQSGSKELEVKSYKIDKAIALLQPLSSNKFKYHNEGVHMYPKFVMNSNGGMIFTDSDGLYDIEGNILHKNLVQGFSDIVFYNNLYLIEDFSRIEIRDSNWNVKTSVDAESLRGVKQTSINQIFLYKDKNSRDQIALSVLEGTQDYKIYLLNDSIKLEKVIDTPPSADSAWVDWPVSGSILLGYGYQGTNRAVKIIDSNDHEVFNSLIDKVSFFPSHLVDVKSIKTDHGNYLGILYNSNARTQKSVFLVYDNKKNLIWQKEYKLSHSLDVSNLRKSFFIASNDGLTELQIVD